MSEKNNTIIIKPDRPEKIRQWVYSIFINYGDIILILILVALSRIIYLSADPPVFLSSSGGLFGDESALAHSARNKVLFGVWVTDEWNPYIYNPILTGLEYLSFSIFGPGLVQIRMINVIAVLAGFYLMYISLRKTAGRRAAFFSVVFLSCNYVFLMYNRLGLNDTFLFLPMTLTFYFWVKGLEADGFLFWAGISSFACYITKASSIYFILAVLLSIALVSLMTIIEKKRFIVFFGGLSKYLLGLIVAYGAWRQFFFLPNELLFERVGSSWFRLAAPHNLGQYFHNLSSLTFVRYLSGAPVLLIVAWVSLPFLTLGFFRNWKKRSPVEIMALMWLIGGYCALNGLKYRPLRYFIPLIPAACIVASLSLDKLWSLSWSKKYVADKLLLIQGIFLGILSFIWSKFLVVRIIGWQRSWRLALAFIVMMMALTFVAFIIQKIHYSEPKDISTRWITSFIRSGVVALILMSIYFQVPAYYRWVKNPKFTVISTSRDIGKLADKTYIGGLWSPLATIENHHKTLYVGNRWFNYIDTFKRFPLTHLFLWDGNNREELRYLKRAYPDVMKNARLIKTYTIKGKPVRLIKLNYDNERLND